MEYLMEDSLEGWNKEDKLLFYHALRSYGSSNIQEIQEYIPNKTAEEIKKAMIYFKVKALKHEEECEIPKERRRLSKKTNHVPLNSWAKLLTETIPFKELRTQTASAIRLIADFETFPPPPCTDKIDFRKVYHTIANALEGKPLYEDKCVIAVIEKCITETALISKAFIRCSSVKHALKDIKINEIVVNPFIKPIDNSELSIIRHILMLKNYNPMNITEEHLKFSLFS